MKTEEKTYELINHEGCYFEARQAHSFKEAREYFASKYEGEFKIIKSGGLTSNSESKNVRL
jgi:hypothetical protein